jgi:hypothetical protein
MKLKYTAAVVSFALASVIAIAQRTPKPDEVEMEMMTYPEIYSAIHDRGKITVIYNYNGCTEQRGPHAVVGGHTLIARAIAPMIAKQLGNALVAPVPPYSTKPAGGVTPQLPGGGGLTPDRFQKVNEAVVDAMVKNGFKHRPDGRSWRRPARTQEACRCDGSQVWFARNSGLLLQRHLRKITAGICGLVEEEEFASQQPRRAFRYFHHVVPLAKGGGLGSKHLQNNSR